MHLQRGIGGGVSLVSLPTELTILDIVNAVEPIQRIKTCPLELKSHGTQLCALHSHMDASLRNMEEAFATPRRSAELLLERNPSAPLCDSTETGATPELPSQFSS